VSGREPALTARGRLVLATAVLLLLAGTALGVWALVGFGLVVLSLLLCMYLAFYPAALALWRRHVEFSWRVGAGSGPLKTRTAAPVRLVAGGVIPVELTVRNRAPVALGEARFELMTSSVVEPPHPPGLPARTPLGLRIGPRTEASLVVETRVPVAGYWCLHGALVHLRDPLGLARLRAYFPAPLPLRTWPRAGWRAMLPAPAVPHARLGPVARRLLGQGGDLRELRDHVPGDPFKRIAWKATARTGRLMVRELDQEALRGHYLLVDVGASMRESREVRSKLDHAVELCATYARAALASGDRVGLIAFDHRIHRHLRSDDRAAAWMRLAECLMDVACPVDPELTELTDGELVASVARYLRHQEGVEARIGGAPKVDDARWARIVAGPDGALYDMEVIGRTVGKLLLSRPGAEAGPGAQEIRRLVATLGSDREMAELRLFCRLRGIELPPRRTSGGPAWKRAFAAALEQVAEMRAPQRVLIWSDLRGLEGDLTMLGRAALLARRRGHQLICLLPETVAYARLPPGEAAARAATIFAWEERRREQTAERQLECLGVSVQRLGPRDGIEAVLGRLAGGRGRRRRR
jgi:uncharacterized protein (DUF58 family)